MKILISFQSVTNIVAHDLQFHINECAMSPTKQHLIAMYALLGPLLATYCMMVYVAWLLTILRREGHPLRTPYQRHPRLFLCLVVFYLLVTVSGTAAWAVLVYKTDWHWAPLLFTAWPTAISILREVSHS
jgi:hypothetical protein